MTKEKKEIELEPRDGDSNTILRLKAMLKAFHAGKFKLPNARPEGSPELNYDNIPDDITVYAHLTPEQSEEDDLNKEV